MSEFLKVFSERLKEERGRLGLSQAAFGEVGGVGKLAQLNYEKGIRSPSAEYLHLLTAAGVDAGYLLTGKRDERIDAALLAGCISAIDDAFSGSTSDLAQMAAVLYLSAAGKDGVHHRLPELAESMLNGWNFAVSKQGAT